jgi:hypothetical protein
MSVPTVSTPMPGVSDRARRLGTWSFIMLPMLLVTGLIGAFVGMWLLGRRGLEGSEPMSVQGAYGWLVWVVTSVVFLLPTMFGVVFGFRARRAGAKGLGLAGMLVNGALLVGIPTTSLISMLT